MFFSSETLYNHFKAVGFPHYIPQSKRGVARYVKACKESILSRNMETGYITERYVWRDEPCHEYEYVGKWTRPWDVVPAIKNFKPPVGDYGIGVEVEMGFTSLASAQHIAKLISNWRHIAIDEEGGRWPLEVTFPPLLYSKLSDKSQPCRYLQLLKKNSRKVDKHDRNHEVGTHVNVSKGGVTRFCNWRIGDANEYLMDISWRDERKFFGRTPYGYGNQDGKDGVLEWKLFNSVTDYKVLKRYINIAVALTDVVASDVEITEEVVMNALNLGYNKAV